MEDKSMHELAGLLEDLLNQLKPCGLVHDAKILVETSKRAEVNLIGQVLIDLAAFIVIHPELAQNVFISIAETLNKQKHALVGTILEKIKEENLN